MQRSSGRQDGGRQDASYARLISHSQTLSLRLEPRVEKEKKDGICGAYQTGQNADRTHGKQGVVDTGWRCMAGGDGRLRYDEVGQLQARLCQARRCAARKDKRPW